MRTWVLGREVFRDGRIDETIRGSEAQFDHSRGGYWETNDA
jgi:dihydroorotase